MSKFKAATLTMDLIRIEISIIPADTEGHLEVEFLIFEDDIEVDRQVSTGPKAEILEQYDGSIEDFKADGYAVKIVR